MGVMREVDVAAEGKVYGGQWCLGVEHVNVQIITNAGREERSRIRRCCFD